jgi:hypothetical protein
LRAHPSPPFIIFLHLSPFSHHSLIIFLSYHSSIQTQLPEETELVWDDSVAPETCVDYDAPHIPTETVVLHFFMGLGFFAGLYLLVSLTNPRKRNPVATRAAILNHADVVGSLGLGTEGYSDEGGEGHGDGDEDEEEEEEED